MIQYNMKVNFYNNTLIAKRINQTHFPLMQYIEENKHLDFDTLDNQIKEKFNPYGAEFGLLTINSKTLAKLKITKEEIKLITTNNQTHIHNKHFKTIIQRINKHIEKNYDVNLSMLKLFFKCSINSKSEYIYFNLQSKEI
jgi:hypothetical protein